MDPEFKRELYTDAIQGRGPTSQYDIEQLTARGLGRWTGGQLDRWDWDRAAVSKLELNDARELYLWLKGGSGEH